MQPKFFVAIMNLKLFNDKKKYEYKNILLCGLKLQAQRSQFGYGIKSILWCGSRTSFG